MFNAMDLKELGIKTAYSYIEKNPEQNLLKLMDLSLIHISEPTRPY